MNLNGNINSEKTQNNLKTVILCSKYETIRLSTEQDDLIKAQLNFLSHPRNKELTEFLKNTYLEQQRSSGKPYVDMLPDKKTLIGFYLPVDYKIPDEFVKSYKDFRNASIAINGLDRTMQEHEDLRGLFDQSHSPNRINLYELNKMLNDKKKSYEFKKFANKMTKNRASRLLSDYRKDAEKLAREKGILTEAFSEKLGNTFQLKTLISGIKDLKKQTFASKGKKIAALTGLGGLVGGGFSVANAFASTAATIDPINIPETSPAYVDSNFDYESQYPDYVQETANLDVQNTTEPNIEIVDSAKLPISNSINIKSYTDAGKDFMQKAAEIYKYNTGADIDLSYLGLKNIGYAETTIYTATLGDQVYRFSGMSTEASNNINLENALTSLGAEVTKTNGNIVYITPDGEKSIAICDSKGNPVKSGNVMGNGGMYNQQFIASAKADLEENGIDTEGMSEQEFIGYYLLSNSDQNEELSRAIAPLVPLARQMENTFRTDKSDSYTVQVYAQMSEEIGNDFNTSTMSKDSQTYDFNYNVDNNSNYDYEDER